ncbi:Uncharacterised protein [uncultured archaeon]|nr:Uncharacterised protein [uncultured archaeon]
MLLLTGFFLDALATHFKRNGAIAVGLLVVLLFVSQALFLDNVFSYLAEQGGAFGDFGASLGTQLRVVSYVLSDSAGRSFRITHDAKIDTGPKVMFSYFLGRNGISPKCYNDVNSSIRYVVVSTNPKKYGALEKLPHAEIGVLTVYTDARPKSGGNSTVINPACRQNNR